MGLLSVANDKMSISTAAAPAAAPAAPAADASSLDPLYSRNPGAAQVTPGKDAMASTSTAGSGSSVDAASRGYATSTREVGAGELAAEQLNKITSLDSPLMQRARQEGMMTSARRGLQNSSIAAGAAQGAMVDRATPLAQQDAATVFSQARANQDALNTQGQFEANAANTADLQNATNATDTSNRNAALETDSNMQNAALQTDTSKFNAGMGQDRALANAGAENALRQQTLDQNAQLNRQFLAGQQSMDLATIQGQYQQLISTNETAASFYNGYFSTIGQLMQNAKDLSPERLAQLIRVNQDQLAAGLNLIDAINTVDFGDAISNPTVGGGAGGVTSTPAGQTPAQDTRPSLETKKVGDRDMPIDTRVTPNPNGRKGHYEVFDANGKKIGDLVPGGKNGRFNAL